MKKKKFAWIYALIGIILLGISSFTFYFMLNQGVTDILSYFGIENFYLQSSIVIIIAIVGLFFLGKGIKRSIENIIKG